jgi:polysaccharide pyruvyl transferase WcaK-like protein
VSTLDSVCPGEIKRWSLLDTSIASTNLGDSIIMEAVRAELASVASDAFPFSVATHEYMGAKSRGLLRRSDWVISGGTNLLSSRMWLRPVWKLTPRDALNGLRVVLMGAGWYQFQGTPDLYSRWLLRKVLDANRLHSVRDSYSEKMLRSIGFENVVNTGCPTLWSLTADHCDRIPQEPAERVVTTLNTYMPDESRDRGLLQLLRRKYREVYFWPQTDADYRYARQLEPGLTMLRPTLDAYEELLKDEQGLDYVGLRLHGGIRAIQLGRRTIIVEIDNRAKTMGSDFHLPTVAQGDKERLERLISEPFKTSIEPPWDAINGWKSQFTSVRP